MILKTKRLKHGYTYQQIDFYKEDNHSIRKTNNEIYEELNESHDELKKWVNQLEDLNNISNN